jgi:hypothetical protein
MQALDIRYDATIDAATRVDIERVIAELERQFPQLPPPIVRPWSEQPLLALDRGQPWLLSPARSDPVMGDDGPAVLPRAQRRQLQHVAKTGAHFHAIAVAHELDPSGPAGSLVDLLRERPRTCSAEVARELVGPVPAHPGLVRAVGMLERLGSTDVPGRAARVLDLLLDPIVFGVVAPWPLTHGVPSVWQPLVAWRW